MLNVPDIIKTLFKTDGINKNFRVHFPNGEHTDLTNSDIVTESVKFTESVSSKSVFQFGLSERSKIEFECVNVPNIYGVTIECGIEIDTGKLSVAEQQSVAEYDGDGIAQFGTIETVTDYPFQGNTENAARIVPVITGHTVQNGTPTTENPVPLETFSMTKFISTDGTNTVNTAANITLRSLPDGRADVLNGNTITRNVQVVTADGNRTYYTGSNNGVRYVYFTIPNAGAANRRLYSDRFIGEQVVAAGYAYTLGGALYMYLPDQTIDTSAKAKAYFTDNPTTFFCALNEPATEPVEYDALPVFDYTTITTDSAIDPLAVAWNVQNVDSYYIPYGTFIVQNCPRSHGAMAHRRVTAYSPKYTSTYTNEITKLKFNYETQEGDNLTLNIPAHYAAERGSLDGLTYTTSALNYSTTTNTGITEAIPASDGNIYTFRINSVTTYGYDVNDVSALYQASCTYSNSMALDLKALLPSGTVIPDTVKRYMYPYLRWGSSVNAKYYFTDPEDSGLLYPYASNIGGALITYTASISYTLLLNGTTLRNATATPCANTAVTKYTLTGLEANYILTFAPTFADNGIYKYFGAVDWQALYDGDLELNAQFGRVGRDGSYIPTNINTDNPYEISAAEYSELWWDDYTIDAIGTIRVTYYDTDQSREQTIEYEIGDGNSVYDMTNNYVLKHLGVTAAMAGVSVMNYVISLLDAWFIPNISGVSFTPFDAEIVGMPFLVAGDCLQIDDGAGGSITSFMLNRSLAGVQTLFDTVEATGGEITEVGETW